MDIHFLSTRLAELPWWARLFWTLEFMVFGWCLVLGITVDDEKDENQRGSPQAGG